VVHKAYLLTSVVSFTHLKQDKNEYKYKKKRRVKQGSKKQHENKRRS
jgi:hypothetical protein